MKRQSLICSSLLVLALTSLFSVSAQAQAYNPLRIVGTVTAFTPADCGKPGSITIAGTTFPIAAGAEVYFLDTMLAIDSSGGLSDQSFVSEVWQVLNTVRGLNVYLDSLGRIRLQAATSFPAPTATRVFDVTGVVTSASPLIINGYSFPIAAGPVTAVADPSKIVRVRGTLNSTTNQLTITAIEDPYLKLTICGAPALFTSAPTGIGLVTDVNSFDADGPIAGLTFIYNPLGSAASQFLCDQSVEVIRVDGAANIRFAPNFTMRQLISKDVNACFEFQMDQFGWVASGKKLDVDGNTKFATVSGTLTAAAPAVAVPGATSIGISRVSFAIAGNNLVTVIPPTPGSAGDPAGPGVCLTQVIDPAGQNGTPTAPGPGTFTRPAALQMIKGTTLKAGITGCHQK